MKTWMALAAVAVLLTSCRMPEYQRRRLEQRGIDPESYQAGYLEAQRQERALREISDGMGSIRWTTPGHYYLRATRNDPPPAPRKCMTCWGHGYVRGPLGVEGQCYACGGTGLER